ncbi:MAG TPA: mechanosensitive ion channel domain-containing protein [Thermoplasmata archaeon]
MELTAVEWEAVYSAVLVAATGLIAEGLSRLTVRQSRRGESPVLTQRVIRQLFRIGWVVIAINLVLWQFQVETALSLAAISGIAALAVTLSLQTMLGNMVAGLLLVRDGAIRLGDRIEFGGVKGKIVLIALRNTWVLTEAGDVAIIGNSALQSGPLINHSGTPRLIRKNEL